MRTCIHPTETYTIQPHVCIHKHIPQIHVCRHIHRVYNHTHTYTQAMKTVIYAQNYIA